MHFAFASTAVLSRLRVVPVLLAVASCLIPLQAFSYCPTPLRFSTIVDASHRAPTLLAARALLDASTAGKYLSYSSLGPELSLDSNTQKHRLSIHMTDGALAKFDSHDFTFTLTQKLADFPTFFKALQAYEEERTQALQYHQAYQNWYLNTGKAYLDWLSLLAEFKTANLAIKAKEEAHLEAAARFKLGLIPKSSALEAQSDRDLAVAQKARVLQSQQAVIAVLQGALGFRPCLPDDYELIETMALQKKAIVKIPEPLKLEYQVLLQEEKALQNVLRQAQSAMWPTVSGFARHGYLNSGGGRFGNFKAHETIYGLNLSWSIFTSGGQLAAIKQASETVRAKGLEAKALRQELIAEQESILAQLKTQEAVMQAEKTRESSAKHLRDSKAIEYREGLDSQLAYLLADNAWREASQSSETAKVDWLKVWLDWLSYTNQLNRQEFLELDDVVHLVH